MSFAAKLDAKKLADRNPPYAQVFAKLGDRARENMTIDTAQQLMDFAVRYVDACDVMHDPAGRDRQEVPDAERTKLEKQYAPELVSTFITAVSESRSQQKR